MTPPDVIRFSCPHCRARLGARPQQLGSRFRCPKCGKTVQVPGGAAASNQPAASRPDPSGEDILGEPDIGVTCSVCHTRYYAPASHAGGHARCPDCQTLNAVRKPTPAAPHKPVMEWTEQDEFDYRLVDDLSPPAREQESWIPVVCQVCSTRMYAREDQVGQLIHCPDCGVGTRVRPVERKLPAVDRLPDVDDVVLAPAYEGTVYRDHAEELLERAEAELREREEKDPRPPERPMIQGIFTYPFRGRMTLLWLGMSAGIWLCLFLVMLIDSFPNPQSVLVGLLMLTVGGTSLIGFVASHLVAVIYNTSEGFDEIVHWPQNHPMEWLLDTLYFINSSAFALAPWLLLERFTGAPELSRAIGLPVAFVLFPIMLLSLLESGSRWIPLSDVVWASIRDRPWEWAKFYLHAIVVTAAVVGAGAAALFSPSHWIAQFGLGFLLTATAAAALIIYCRAIGRLVLVCGVVDSSEIERDAEDLPPEGMPAAHGRASSHPTF